MAPETEDVKIQKLLDEYEKRKRTFSGRTAQIITIIAVAGSLWHIYALGIAATSVILLRNLHVMFGFILIPLLYPGFDRNEKISFFDILMVLSGIAVTIYVFMQDHSFILRAGVSPTQGDIIFGVIAIFLVLAITKRVLGWPLVIVALAFMVYAKFGSYFPGMFIGRNYSLSRIISYVFNIDGIYGITTGVSSTYVVLFILFGAFLKNSGAGELYTDLSYAIAGRAKGGPAKVSVISSALFGTISGSGIANVVTTGSMTIPLMKKSGFRKEYAGAVEAVASTGGQIMPPVMGAGAFLMAEMIGVPYKDVMIAAILPALLYFVTTFFVIDLRAGKDGLVGLKAEELPSIKEVIRTKGHLILPLIMLLYALIIQGATPIRAAFLSIIACVVVSYFRKVTRMDIKSILNALETGIYGSLEVIAACACAGIIMALVSLTGIGLKLSTLIVILAGSSLFLALILTAVIIVILSMGLPTTACYLIGAAIMAPALTQLGISPLQSHLFIFYFACLSGITPPVALAAYPAGAIAKANPVTVSFVAFRMAIVGFIIPFIMVYSPAILLIGKPLEVAIVVVTSLVGAYAIAVATEGWFKKSLHMLGRVLLLVGGICMIVPGSMTDFPGIVLIVLGYLVGTRFNKKLRNCRL
ncbi:MAG: TRAP transporter permease [Firmicutes bacterium]|nr:TRAP transporter permease [Bacillota bacterium]